VHDPFEDDDPAELAPTIPAPVARAQEREGLPPGYRMRADAHYVDQLTSRDQSTSRRTERGVDSARSAAVEDLPEEDEPTDRARVRSHVLARLTEGLGSIASASALLAGDASPLARRATLDVIRAETWRAAWLVAAQGILDAPGRLQIRPRLLGPILERVRQGFEPECRLSDTTLHFSASDWNVAVAVDEGALVAGITGALVATLGLLGRPEGAVIRVSAETHGGELRSLEIAQDDVSVPSSASLRFFDPVWAERPGGWMAGIGAATAKAVAQQHGGNAVLLVGERRGTVIRLQFARAF
jgi:hypothetical protein